MNQPVKRYQPDIECEFTDTIHDVGGGNVAEFRVTDPNSKSSFGATFCMSAADISTEIERRQKTFKKPVIDEFVLAKSKLDTLSPKV